MHKAMKSLTLTLAFSIIIAFSHATPTFLTRLQPQMNQSSVFNLTQQQIYETKLVKTCSYMIKITTSCNSPAFSKDTVGILFGDALGNEVVMLNVDSPDIHTLDQCKTLTFEVLGNCIGKICKLYVARVGSDGWIPETITAYHSDYPPVAFNYNYFIPDDNERYGFDYCQRQA